VANGIDGVGNREQHPIKHVMPNQGSEWKVPSGGSSNPPFRPVNKEYRRGLLRQVSATLETLLLPSNDVSAVPIRVQLIPKAIAKTHRPKKLLSSETCPIVGAGKPGELFVKATPSRLESLADAIRSGETKQLVREISCVEAIEPITSGFRRRGLTPGELLKSCPDGAKRASLQR
jgi:hypothetical protein